MLSLSMFVFTFYSEIKCTKNTAEYFYSQDIYLYIYCTSKFLNGNRLQLRLSHKGYNHWRSVTSRQHVTPKRKRNIKYFVCGHTS